MDADWHCGAGFSDPSFKRISLPGVFEVDFIRNRYQGALKPDGKALAVFDSEENCSLLIEANEKFVLANGGFPLKEHIGKSMYAEIAAATEEFYRKCENAEINSRVDASKVEYPSYNGPGSVVLEPKSICEMELEAASLRFGVVVDDKPTGLYIVDGNAFLWLPYTECFEHSIDTNLIKWCE